MTSSLVGSEMCIRDSTWGSPPAGSVYPHWRSHPLACRHRGVLLQRLRPVSYTHLTLPTICSV
eukprot:7645986-Prorocentrum_lima.AAC.1